MKKCFSKGKPLYMPYTLRLLTAMMLITLLVATIIGVALCKLAISSIRNMESSLTQKNMEIVAQNMNRALNSVDEFCVEVVTSKYVQDICQNRLPIESVETAIANLEDYLETSVRVGTDSYGIEFNFVNIYLKDGTHNIIQFDALPFSNFEECSEYYIEQGTIDAGRYTPMTWLDSVKLRDRSGKMVNSLIWIRYLYDAITMEKVGIMVGGVSEDTFKDIFEIFPQAYLCHSSGKILSSTDTELFQSCIPKTIKDNVLSSHLSVDSFKYENITHRLCFWKESYYSLILIVPEGTMQQDMSNMTQAFFSNGVFIIILGVLIGSLVNFFMSRKLSYSIIKLKETVQQVDQGDVFVRFKKPRFNDEITYLGEHINHMLDSLEHIYSEQEKEAVVRKDLEIQLLQSQINPHLLYNTLNSVALSVRNNQRETAEILIYTLSDFVRLSLSKGRAIVPLSTELELLQKYILIQKLASHRTIRLEIDIPEECLHAMVIRTSLQPIVENAIIHGFAGYQNDGVIQITGSLSQERKEMIIIIRDNGIGITPPNLEKLNASINQRDYKAMCAHFGLSNVNWRIKYTWGSEDYGITVDSELGDYTEVRMTLPYVEKPKDVI